MLFTQLALYRDSGVLKHVFVQLVRFSVRLTTDGTEIGWCFLQLCKDKEIDGNRRVVDMRLILMSKSHFPFENI